jgi:phosphoribosylformylglycinamidine synthase
MPVRVLVLRAPGTNCDQETAFAFEQAGGKADFAHINRLLEEPKLFADYQIVALPGGFSYGDDIAAGRILANQIRHHLYDALAEFKAAGKLILGICNGFQILIKSGVLLPDRADEPLATLTLNDSGKFEARWVHLGAVPGKCVFLKGIESLYLPVAHAEGKFVPRDAAALQQLEAAGQIVLRYCDPTNPTSTEVAYPACPNGAAGAIAGVCDESGRVFGLMPHPERHIDPTQHPHWTREPKDRGDGLAIFENAICYFG